MIDQDLDRNPEEMTVPPDGQPLETQPKWRRDFPIDWPEDEYISRRDFIKFLLLTSGAFTTGQLWLWLRTVFADREGLEAVAIASVDEVPVGGSMIFHYPEEDSPARLLVRLDEEVFVAYEQQCTHLLCPVVPAVDELELHCPCHEGIFDLMTGRPLAGPPRRPLARVTLAVREGTVYATGIERRTV